MRTIKTANWLVISEAARLREVVTVAAYRDRWNVTGRRRALEWRNRGLN
jgi:hypothetical protein